MASPRQNLTTSAMNGLMDLTSGYFAKLFGEEVDESYVVIAKHSVMGTDDESLCQILGCSGDDLAAIKADELFAKIRAHVAAIQATMIVDQSSGWDQIEQVAMTNLLKRLPHETDKEFLLKAATLANRAHRKMEKTGILEPGLVQGHTVITLTDRIARRLSNRGDEEVVAQRQVRITNGSASNPSFSEVDNMLQVRTEPMPANPRLEPKHDSFDIDALAADMLKR